MTNGSNQTASSKVTAQVLTAVIIALVVGGSAPWWWDKIFSSNDTSTTTTASTVTTTSPSATAASQVELPSVTDLDISQARRLLDSFEVIEVPKVTELKTAGVVLSQDPDAGTTATVGSTIRLTVATPPSVLAQSDKLEVDNVDPSAEGVFRVSVDLDSGLVVDDTTADLWLALGIETYAGAEADGVPTYDDCVELLTQQSGDVLFGGQNTWYCVRTDQDHVSAVRYIGSEKVSSTPIVLKYTLQFVTWDVPAGTF